MPSTGVLMRLLEISGDDYSIDEVILQPGVTANWLRFPQTRAEHRAMAPGARLEIAGGRPGTFGPSSTRSMAVARARIVSKGEWHRLSNPSGHALTVNVTLRPSWNPKRAHFRLGDRQFRGDEVWFEVKTHLGDKTVRAMYQLHALSAAKGDVSVRLEPGAESIETFHRTATVTVVGAAGEGELVVDGAVRPIRARTSVVVQPGQHYQLKNRSRKPFEVNQTHKPQWEPHDTFYVSDGRTLPGNQVWFEFVVPD